MGYTIEKEEYTEDQINENGEIESIVKTRIVIKYSMQAITPDGQSIEVLDSKEEVTLQELETRRVNFLAQKASIEERIADLDNKIEKINQLMIN